MVYHRYLKYPLGEGGSFGGLFGRKTRSFLRFSVKCRMVIRGGDILRTVVNDYRILDVKMAKLTAMNTKSDR